MMLSTREHAEQAHLDWLRSKATDPLPRLEERRLLHLAYAGDRAAEDRLVRANLRFVYQIAAEYAGPNAELLLELIAAGHIGLMTAIHRYDVTSHHKLITYAVWWIRQQILYHLNTYHRTIRLPANVCNELARHRTADTLDAVLEADSVEGERMRAGVAALQTSSLDAAMVEDGQDMVHWTADPTTPPMDQAIDAAERKARIDRGLSRLDRRYQIILTRCFGLDGEPPDTLEAIAVDLNLTRERIRQLRNKALCLLRQQPELADLWRALCE